MRLWTTVREELDECGVCGGPGIVAPACDCEGNVEDECGICGGPGIEDPFCDCDGNVEDECGVCGGDGSTCVEGCTDPAACNFDPAAVVDDGSCEELDECGVCGGPGIVAPACDCEGNVEDECGICGGPGIEDPFCDCDGNVEDECGVCGGDGSTCVEGCTDPAACNFDPAAVVDDGSCEELDECGVCGGPGIVAPACDCAGNVQKTNAAFAAVLALRIRSATVTAMRKTNAACAAEMAAAVWKAAPTPRRATLILQRSWTTVHARSSTSAACVAVLASWLRPAIVRATSKTNAAFVADLALRNRSATVTAMWRTSAVCAAEMAAPVQKAARIPRPAIMIRRLAWTMEVVTSAVAQRFDGRHSVCLSLDRGGFPSVQAGLTVYRFYVQLENETDRMSAIFGDDQVALQVSTPAGTFNSPLNASWNASGINPAFTGAFPELIDDSYATIGLDGPASVAPSGSEDPLLIEGDVPVINNHFTTDGSDGLR